MKVFVLRDEYAAMSACQLPNGRITSPALAEETNVKGIGKEIAHCGYQLFGQLFVEEEPHDSGCWDPQCSALPLSRVRQTCADVFASELREIVEDLLF